MSKIMAEDGNLECDGVVIESLPGVDFKVRLDNGHELIAHLSGKMRKYFIKILLGDRVVVKLSPYNLDMGRIIERKREDRAN